MIFLVVRRDTWQEKHESVTFVKSSRLLTELKCHPDFVWLKFIDSMALVSSTPSGKYFVSSDVSWAEFFRMLEYKVKLYGCDLVKVDTFE